MVSSIEILKMDHITTKGIGRPVKKKKAVIVNFQRESKITRWKS